MVVKGGSEVDGSWFRSDVVGDTITVSTNIANFWLLHAVVLGGAGAGNGLSKTCGFMRVIEVEDLHRQLGPSSPMLGLHLILLRPLSLIMLCLGCQFLSW